MKQILILIACLALAGCTKSFTEVEAARAKCTSVGGKLVIFNSWGNPQAGVARVACDIDGTWYREGNF